MGPYARIRNLRRAHRARDLSWAAWAWGVLAPLGAAALCLPLFERLFLSFMQQPPSTWSEGVSGALLRVGWFVVGFVALDMFSAVVRGRDREVLQVYPVDPGPLVADIVRSRARRNTTALMVAGILFVPIARDGAAGLWLLTLLELTGVWALAHCAGALVVLWAIEVSEDPRYGPLLDAVRGNNPRAQAAFLYAPGAVLGLVGTLHMVGVAGVPLVMEGSVSGWLLVVAPFLVAPAAWWPVWSLARRAWFNGSVVLAEIHGRYEALEDPDERRRVYLDWCVRWVPEAWRAHTLRLLRHGWRARRGWVLGAWWVGILAGGVAWTSDPLGAWRALCCVAVGAWTVGVVALVMSQSEPHASHMGLPVAKRREALATVVVVVAWLQPCLWPAVFSAGVRAGASAALGVLCWGALSLAVTGCVAGLCARGGTRTLPIYAGAGACASTWLGHVAMGGGLT